MTQRGKKSYLTALAVCPTRYRASAARLCSLPHIAFFSLTALSTACGADQGPPHVETEAESDAGNPPPADPRERLPGGETTNTFLFGVNSFTRAASNISPENESLFFSGNSFFNSAWVEAPASTQARDGLGPLFNARSCAACHFKDGRGRPPLEVNEEVTGLLLRVGTGLRDASGAPEGDPSYGGQLQPLGISDVPPEATIRVEYEVVEGAYEDDEPFTLLAPSYQVSGLPYGDRSTFSISPRVAPQVIGLGLLEAIPAKALDALADPEDEDEDGISGRLNRVWDVRERVTAIGRFGWKAEQPTVEQQTAGAFLGDMGITSSLFPEQDCTPIEVECLAAISGGEPEIDDERLRRVVVYSSLLAVPARERWRDDNVLLGKALFSEVGCAACHVPSFSTGESKLAEVSEQLIWPYTDLLLHDMGEALSDERPSYEAEGREWRTPPLWGIGRIETVNKHNRLLHDGRARGVAEAILWHGGEGENSKERFRALDADERQALVDFVESL